jgi:hypothetical protein
MGPLTILKGHTMTKLNWNRFTGTRREHRPIYSAPSLMQSWLRILAARRDQLTRIAARGGTEARKAKPDAAMLAKLREEYRSLRRLIDEASAEIRKLKRLDPAVRRSSGTLELEGDTP